MKIGNKIDKKEEKIIKELKEKNIALENFINSAFHDLKTPIFTLQGFLNNFKEDYYNKLDEKGMQYLYLISKSANKLERMVNDIFEVFKCEKLDFQFQKLDILEIINLSLDRLQMFIDEDINLDYSELKNFIKKNENIYIYGSLNFLTDVLVNLIGNSIKYRKDDIDLYIKIGLAEETTDKYIFFLEDNGIGIDEKYHDFVFEFFNRLKEKDVEGTGMGLAIVKKIIIKHKGEIWFKSKKGGGTTFYFSLLKY